MIGEKTVEEKPITMHRVKELLKERKKEKELTYEQDQTYKYASTFSKLPNAKTQKLLEELKKLESISEELAIKFVDTMPMEEEVIKLIPDKKDEVSEEDLKAALELIKKFKPKEK